MEKCTMGEANCEREASSIVLFTYLLLHGATTAVAQWLSCCATNRKVAGSIPDGVIEIFH